MYLDKDQFYVCNVGSSALPYLETDKTPLIVFSFTWLQRSSEFQQKWKSWRFYAKISLSVVIMLHFFSLISTPSDAETTNYSLLNRWAPIHNQARTISRPWLDSFPLVAACSHCGSLSHHGDGGDCGHWGVGHHFPGLLRCPGRGVQTPLLPPSRPAAPLWLQVSKSIQSQ